MSVSSEELGNAYVTGLRDGKVEVIQGQMLETTGNVSGPLGKLTQAYVTCLRDFSRSRSFKVKVRKVSEIVENIQKTQQQQGAFFRFSGTVPGMLFSSF